MSTNDINKQSGLVSFIVVITLVIILSLITTSFALLTRREQRRALDRQLSTQAFYAAESGVNAAIKKVQDNPGLNKNDCALDASWADQNLGDQLSYTCVLVNNQPTSLEYSPVLTDESKVIKVQSVSGNITKISISWQASDITGSPTFSSGSPYVLPQKPPVSNSMNSPTGTGMLRASIMPILSGGISRVNLAGMSRTLFLYPKGSAGTPVTYTHDNVMNSTQDGQFVDGNCNSGRTPKFCQVDVDVSSLNTGLFYLRLRSVYKNSNVSIKAYNNAGTELPLIGAQAVIDSTGKANDVLRRIQVRVPIENTYYYPEYGIETTGNLCKKLNVFPSFPAVLPVDACSY